MSSASSWLIDGRPPPTDHGVCAAGDPVAPEEAAIKAGL
jgi:hypothetical protein